MTIQSLALIMVSTVLVQAGIPIATAQSDYIIPCVAGTGTDYPVGPGQANANISDVPWGSLGAGDTVRIYYKPTPYKEKIIIRTSGTQANPIRICGVPGPGGQRPVLDGDGASNDSDDSAAYGGYAPMQGLAMIMIYNNDYDLKDSNITIDGLHIKNAKNTFSYTRTDGSSSAYESGAACIRVQAGDNIIIRNNEIENCGNGIFTMSQGYNEASLTRNILIEGNHIHGSGQAGSYREHGLYIQAIGATYQYNHFGANAVGSDGVGLKERVAGSVIRYNWFDSGNSRMVDMVEVEDAAAWYIVDEYLAELGCTNVNNCPGIDQNRLQKVQEAEDMYRKSYVYGNFFNHIGSQTNSGNIIHYGSDNSPSLSRNGTLYFYHNSISIKQDQSDAWRFRLLYLGNRNATTAAEETIELFNNIIYFRSETNAATPSVFCLNDTTRGNINFGANWMSDGWNAPDIVANCYYGVSADAPTLSGTDNLITDSNPPIDNNLDTIAGSLAENNAQAIPANIVNDGYTPIFEYVRHHNNKARTGVTDLGGQELSGAITPGIIFENSFE